MGRMVVGVEVGCSDIVAEGKDEPLIGVDISGCCWAFDPAGAVGLLSASSGVSGAVPASVENPFRADNTRFLLR